LVGGEREREREREDEEAEEIEAAMACVASAASFFLPARLLRGQGGQEKNQIPIFLHP